jgi:translation initiation factor IF-1
MNIQRVYVGALVLAAMSSSTWAQQAAPATASPPPSMAMSNTPAVTSKLSTVTATVQAVYPDKRSVTLVGPDGNPQTIFVSEKVKLDRIKAGDKVRVSYYQGLAAQIAKNGQTVTDPAGSTFAYKNPNSPGGGAGASVTVTVKILGIDPGTNKVAFEAQDGTRHVVAVKSPNMRQFIRTLKPGDVVDVTYTESVAVTVMPAPGASAPSASGT